MKRIQTRGFTTETTETTEKRRRKQRRIKTVLSRISFVLRGQAEKPLRRGLDFFYGDTGTTPAHIRRHGGSAPMAQVGVLAVLAGKGLLAVGTPLEVMPAALPPGAASLDPRAFRATVADPMRRRRSLLWVLDGQAYSPTELTCKLWREYGVASLGPSYFSHWRVVGRQLSLWDESRSLAEDEAAV
jgi:hypothetical protein